MSTKRSHILKQTGLKNVNLSTKGLTTNSPGIPGIHLIDLRKIKG